MDTSGAISDEAKRLNEGRPPYEGGAAAKAREDLRRELIKACPAERILDAEHMHDLVEHVATWAPDIVRQAALRKAGSGQLGQRILRPDEYDALLAQVRAAKT